VLEAIASTRGMSAGILAGKQISNAQRQAVTERLTVIRFALERQRVAIASAIETDPALRARLAADEHLALTEALVKSIAADLLAETITADPGPFWTAASKTLDAHYATAGRFLDVLDDLLERRVAALKSEQRVKFGVTLVFMLLAAYFLYAFYLVTRGGLVQLSDHIVRMAAGDFSARPWPWGRDEVADSLDKLRDSLAAMSQMMAEIRHQADSVSHAAQEIASGNQDLSGRTESSAAAVEQSARGMEQLRDQVGSNVQSIGQADSTLGALMNEIGELDRTVGTLVQRMNSLHAQSKEIAEIVGLIDGIAFQTNILALNASVEAARAGDMGRGFAVVAQEVRALAQRSAQAARQISGIVRGSTDEIQAGTALAQSAGGTVTATVASAQAVATVMRDVRQNSEQQRVAVEQAHGAMNQLASATQGNAALVEEIAAATTSLAHSGDRLTQLVARFKLGDAH
jgi:methyl-accepting chemotaxis protein